MKEHRAGSPNNNKSVIEGMQHLILCEGIDEWGFLVYLLNSDALSGESDFSTVFQVENFGGNEELPIQLQLWAKAPGFDRLKSVTVFRDAERDFEAAKRQVVHAFESAKLPVPAAPHEPKTEAALTTGFLLFPDCSNKPVNGTLEDMCLSMLEEEEPKVLQMIDLFMDTLQGNKLRRFPHEFKTRLHTYFSVTDDYVSLKVGEAAKAGAFNWRSPRLQSLKDYLRLLLQRNYEI